MHSSVNDLFTHSCLDSALAAIKQCHRVILDDLLCSIVTCSVTDAHCWTNSYADLISYCIEGTLYEVHNLGSVSKSILRTTVLYFRLCRLSCYVFLVIRFSKLLRE